MSKVLAYLKEMLASGDGSASSKRILTSIFAFLLMVAFVANLFWDYTIEEFIFNSVMYIVIAGFGFTGMEKFAPKRPGEGSVE